MIKRDIASSAICDPVPDSFAANQKIVKYIYMFFKSVCYLKDKVI